MSERNKMFLVIAICFVYVVCMVIGFLTGGLANM